MDKLLSEMEKNKFKGTYKIIGNDTIEWKIQDNVTVMILLCASDAGIDDVIYFYYKDPNGNEHKHNMSDDYPHHHIMELLSEYNNCKFEIKEKGLFRKNINWLLQGEMINDSRRIC